MQRKNNFLNQVHPKQRSGMALIMAIMVVVILATIMALSLSLTMQTGKRTTDVYLHEQVVLYAKSAAELALLDIAKDNNSTSPCNVTSKTYSFDSGLYTANVAMKYVYTTVCATASNSYFTITTDEQSGSVLMDITVTTNAGTEPIRYFRRSIQKL